MDPILPVGLSPVSPFVYDIADQENSAVSSPKQVCRRPNRSAALLKVTDSSVNVTTPVSGTNRSLSGTSATQQPLSGFTGRISFGDSLPDNRFPLVGSPMSVSPVVTRPACSALRQSDVSGCPHAQVKEAVSKSVLQPDLIGDFTSCHALPLICGQHPDLKTISANTMARLIRGEFADTVLEHVVVDCRYPYEYEGGHIVGAVNIYTREGLVDKFFNANGNTNADSRNGKRKVIIFHCEFSSKRGPKLYRFIRSQDRQHNAVNYPQLTYPELYILEGGYKAFYESYRHLCEPDSYLPMEADKNALRQFQSVRSKPGAKSDTNRNGGGQRGYKRTTLGIRNFD